MEAFNRENGYPNDIRDLVKKDGADERVLYSLLAPLGMLFPYFLDPIGVPSQSENFCLPNGPKRKIFDQEVGEWIWFNAELYESIPNTYSFAPRPIDVHMEMDYFVRSFGLPKHHFIWSDGSKGILREHFGLVRSIQNGKFHGHYTLTPWLPSIKNLGRLMSGFYVTDNEDYEAIFT